MVSDMADVCPKCGAAVTQAPVETQPQPEAFSNNPSKPKRKGVLIVCIVAVLLLIGGGAAWYFHDGNKPTQSENEHPVYSEELRKKAEAGDAMAQCDLGACYEDGNGVAQDAAEVLKWYQKAADQGNARGQRCLANLYAQGLGVKQDFHEAVKLYRMAAEQGDSPAMCNLGVCYAHGYGVIQDQTEAFQWYRRAAEKGNDLAQYAVGVCYDTGNGTTQDVSEAVKWYRKSAKQGCAAGEAALGVCYAYGDGVAQDYTEAVKWLKSAVDKGNGCAMYYLGISYGYGYGVEKNQNEADRLYKMSAETGFQPAIDFLNQQKTGNAPPSRQEHEAVNFTGTYEFNDGFHTWVLVLNADESATIQEKEHQNDPDMTSYGSWSYYKYTQPDNLNLRFTDLAAKVWFKSSNNFVSLSYPVINIKDGFLYMNDNAAKAKNPNLRIKLTKTK